MFIALAYDTERRGLLKRVRKAGSSQLSRGMGTVERRFVPRLSWGSRWKRFELGGHDKTDLSKGANKR